MLHQEEPAWHDFTIQISIGQWAVNEGKRSFQAKNAPEAWMFSMLRGT
jgi:hypothetical protein